MTDVMHGTGKPRLITIEDTTTPVHSDTVASSTATTVVLTTGGATATSARLVGRALRTSTSGNVSLLGKITAYDSGTKTVAVDEWLPSGSPGTSKPISVYGQIIDLPYCRELKESFEMDSTVIKLFNGGYVNKKKGWYYKAILDYSNYITKDTMEDLELLFTLTQSEFATETYFRFYPRRENLGVSYLVDLFNGYTLEYAQKAFHRNHKFVVLELTGINKLTSLDLTTAPAGTGGYGEDYADGMYT